MLYISLHVKIMVRLGNIGKRYPARSHVGQGHHATIYYSVDKDSVSEMLSYCPCTIC